MFRFHAAACLTLLAALACAKVAPAQGRPGPPPVTYEVMINGESFEVEANKMVTVQSKETPGVSYRIAVRVSPVQRLKLDRLQLEYDQQTKVEDDHKAAQRGAKLQHELGFTVLITEVGDPLDEADRDKALEVLATSVEKALRKGSTEADAVTVARLPNHQFRGCEGRGVRFRRKDAEGTEHGTLVYLLTGKTFTASCLVEFLEEEADDVLPLIRRTLDSIGPLEAAATRPTK